jgi:hypothetical protein
MTRRIRLLVLAAVVALIVLVIPSGADAGLRSCGGGVRAAVVSCAKAKRIATEFNKTHAHKLQGYNCGSGRSRGRCVLDRKVVTFPLKG